MRNEFCYSVVDFRWDGFEAEAWFGTDGWVMTETDIPYQSLPEAVRTSFEASQYANWKIEDIDKVERLNTETVYVIEVESGETEYDLYYSSNGILIKDQPDQGGSDNPYLPEQTPTDIESKVKEMYPNAQILPLDYDPDVSFANIENRQFCQRMDLYLLGCSSERIARCGENNGYDQLSGLYD